MDKRMWVLVDREGRIVLFLEGELTVDRAQRLYEKFLPYDLGIEEFDYS